ncbi:hypothetical protein [Azohydromonas lata]|uniref:hypothetical protein n=1 Tax=Azohydromonas lata TaxID=45677 RepID=UPI0008327E46|nr:hypothetical protein [Azohydromonas lata]
MTLSIIQPRQPTASGWRLATWWTCPRELAEIGYPVQAWEHTASGLFVLSAVEVAHDPGAPDLGPEYHLSISLRGHRCSTADALFALAAFELLDATEDNHVPGGKVRNFWRAVADHLSGHVCPCQDEEPAMREDRGDYVWRGVTR